MIGPDEYEPPEDLEDDDEDDGSDEYRAMYVEDSADDICHPLYDGQ